MLVCEGVNVIHINLGGTAEVYEFIAFVPFGTEAFFILNFFYEI